MSKLYIDFFQAYFTNVHVYDTEKSKCEHTIFLPFSPFSLRLFTFTSIQAIDIFFSCLFYSPLYSTWFNLRHFYKGISLYEEISIQNIFFSSPDIFFLLYIFMAITSTFKIIQFI